MFFNDKTISISSCDIMTIFNKTIQQMMLVIITKSCFSCGDQFKRDDLNQLSCSCLMCRGCLLKMIKKSTDNKIILTKYEKSINKGHYCTCVGIFNIAEATTLIKEPFTEEYNQAMIRMAQIVANNCMICCRNLLEDNKNNNNEANNPANAKKKDYVQLKIAKQNNNQLKFGIDYIDSDHLICFKCIKKLGLDNSSYSIKKKREKVKDKKVKGNDREIDIEDQLAQYCTICNIEHIIDKKGIYIKRDTVCCTNQCILV